MVSEKAPLSYYGEWQESEGIPIVRGLTVDEVDQVEVGPWRRKGVRGAFIRLDGAEETLDSYVCEIPSGASTRPEKYMFEEAIFVLRGRGATTVWQEGSKKHTFEWQRGSVFSPPINTWRQHFNGSGEEPARFIAFTNAPLVMNMFRSERFIFNNNYAFTERFNDEDDYFSKGGSSSYSVYAGREQRETNFISDIYDLQLEDRWDQSDFMALEMASNALRSHVAELPVGTYMTAHRHGPGAHIFVLKGEGYSLFWREGEEKQKIDWKAGSLISPPDMVFHQHFVTSREPARHLAFHFGGWRVMFQHLFKHSTGVSLGGHKILYHEEDPEVLRIFQAELARRDMEPEPIDTWRVS